MPEHRRDGPPRPQPVRPEGDSAGQDGKTPRDDAGDAYRPDAEAPRDHATDQFRPRDEGQLEGDWDWRRARPGEVEGDYGRGYGNAETGTDHRDEKYGEPHAEPEYENPGDTGHGLRKDDRRYDSGHRDDGHPPRRRDDR